ncbi:MAG: carbohydrate porin [Planctomycetes bacterium]|nr:carbohydrate porin [Planctomycetota bacterium]
MFGASSTLLAFPCPAQELALEDEATAEDREWIGGRPFGQWTRVTGDWGGIRTDLEDHGIEIAASYTADWATPMRGGLRYRDSYISLTDINVAFDLDTIAGLEKTFVYFDGYKIHGPSPSNDIGDAQGVSNIQGRNITQVAEMWIETWIGDHLRVKFGKVDFNSEFAFSEYSGDFINSTAAIPPSIVAYPTYPNPATSLNAFYQVDDTTYVGAGVYDGAGGDGINTGNKGLGGFFESEESDSWFLAAEVGTAWTGGGSWGSGRAALGVWHHTAKFTEFGGGQSDGSTGGWLTVEQQFVRENPDREEDSQGLYGFVTFGIADENVATFARTLAIGASWVGPLPSRDDDSIGLAIFHADLSDEPGSGTPRDETVFELTYKAQLTPAIILKPDLQFIRNPGGAAGVRDALAGLLRIEITL